MTMAAAASNAPRLLFLLLLLATPALVQCLASSAGRPRTVFDPEKSASALAKYNSGAYSTTGLAREFGMTYPLMRRMLQEAGADLKPKWKRNVGFDPEKSKAALAKYNSGAYSVTSLAREFGMTYPLMRRVLIEAGADLKPIKKRNETAVPPDIIARGLAGGYNCMQIASRENLTYHGVRYAVKTNQTLADMQKDQRSAVEELALAKGEELAREAESADEDLRRSAQEARATLASKMERRRQLAMRTESAAPFESSRLKDMEMVRLRQSGLTLQSIGDRYGISRERVRQRLGRCNLSGLNPNLPDEAELQALGCIFEAVTDPEVFSFYTREDSEAAFAETCKVAESFGLSVSGLKYRLEEHGSMRRRKERLLLKLNSSIALEIGRGTPFAEIAGAVGVCNNTVIEYSAGMGLHRKRDRLAGVTREDYESGQHPFDAEIDERIASGESSDSIARDLGLSSGYVTKRARRGTVEAESQQDQVLCELASQGLGAAAIAAQTGKSRSWVSHRATLLGVRITRQPLGRRKASSG